MTNSLRAAKSFSLLPGSLGPPWPGALHIPEAPGTTGWQGLRMKILLNWKERGQIKALVLHTADPAFIPSFPYGPPTTAKSDP